LEAGSESLAPQAAPGRYVQVTVADTGMGMSPEIRARIFEPFYTTKELGSGTGLGLSTSQAIVEAHGGFLQVQSTVGLGTVFQMFLPADTEAGAPAGDAQRVPPPPGHGELVLLVDDETAIRSILAETLETCGYRVVIANGGPQAVALCAREPGKFRLLITDMDMPIMDGAATIMAIRTVDPQIKVIATSGTRPQLATTQICGAQGFLLKPYSADEVLHLVHAVINGEANVGSSPLSS
jgi:CheY-like chemotaxis protein